MINGLFLVITLVWILVSQQVNYWAVISALGFKTETPELFIRKDYLYFLVSWMLFLSTIVLAFLQTFLYPWILIIIIIMIRIFTKKYAQKSGCVSYRKILKEIKEHRILQGEDVSDIDENINKNNAELLKEAYQRDKFGIT